MLALYLLTFGFVFAHQLFILNEILSPHFFVAGINKQLYSVRFHGCSDTTTQKEITMNVLQLIYQEFGTEIFGKVEAFPASSCNDIFQFYNGSVTSGLYWILLEGNLNLVQMTCFA